MTKNFEDIDIISFEGEVRPSEIEWLDYQSYLNDDYYNIKDIPMLSLQTYQ